MWEKIPPEIREQVVGLTAMVLTALGVAVVAAIKFYTQKLFFEHAATNMVKSIEDHGTETLKISIQQRNELDGIEHKVKPFVDGVTNGD